MNATLSMNKKPTAWILCCVGVILLVVLTFTPIVLPKGVYEPELYGIPRTLWLGILIDILLVALTLIGGYVHPVKDQDGLGQNQRDRG